MGCPLLDSGDRHLLLPERWHAKLLVTVATNDWRAMRTTAGTRELPKPRRQHARNNPEKWCPRCETWKPRDEQHFYRAKNGWQGYCIPCAASAPRSISNRPGKADQLKALKDGQPCADCHVPYRFFQLDYDHRPDEVKLAPVARMMSQNCAWDKILAEIAKCDLVCANCHRMRTFTRGQTKGLDSMHRQGISLLS